MEQNLDLWNKPLITDSALRSIIELNNAMAVADEAECERLIELEKAGRKRKSFLRRIHCRLNKVRGERERKAILED